MLLSEIHSFYVSLNEDVTSIVYNTTHRYSVLSFNSEKRGVGCY